MMKYVLMTDACKLSQQQTDRITKMGYEIFICRDDADRIPDTFLKSQAIVCNRLLSVQDIEDFPDIHFIQLTSSGLDHMPLDKIRQRGIVLCNARGVYSIPIAEWVVLKILEMYKNTRFFHDAQRSAQWIKNREMLELNGKTAGIIGTGSIGCEIAKRLKAFGCKVIGLNLSGGCNEFFDSTEELGALDRFLAKCDIVILALPLTPQTRNLINRKNLCCMKNNAVLVNVSRGSIVNEEDLLQHLDRGYLKGAALDVFENEPLPELNPLWHHPRVLVTPHNSFVSENNTDRLFELVFSNLLAFQEGKPFQNIVDVWKR